jgi:phosphinothricin acetyltransferase
MSAGDRHTLIIRDSRDGDVDSIARIYGYWVTNGFGTFEYEPPAKAEVAQRREKILAAGFPHLVAELDGAVLGYTCAGPYRPRVGYRYTCENSIYVAPEAARKGVGSALLSPLIARCEAQGFRLMIAVIGDSGNASSIGLHTALGFEHAGVLPAVGWKHGRWVDTVFMTRMLGMGSTIAPDSDCHSRRVTREPSRAETQR